MQQKKIVRRYMFAFYCYAFICLCAFVAGGLTRYTYTFIIGFIALIIACCIIILKSLKEIKFKLGLG